ncbi:MAG TPA: condensation domain-containing protein, partial [Longimicrobium sp.]|nr:condensation domain-containing protein [Longimicrobium sp.]
MTPNDLAQVRGLAPEEKRALLRSLLRQEPTGSRVAPLSFAQQRLWFLEALEDLGGTYHVPLRHHLRGPLDVAALRRALDRIVARHEVLRTTFGQVDGKPVQRIAAAQPDGFSLAEHDLRGVPEPRAALRDLVAREARERFDLAAGPPVRGRLVRVADDEHVLLVTMHHIVSDAWSMGVFARELGTLYTAFRGGGDDPLPALPTQYADHAAWQRRRVEGELLARQAGYWERALAGAPELLELPADHPRPARQDFAGGSVPLALDAELTAGLQALSRRHGTTLFMTLLAGWAVVLGRLSGQTDVVVGTPTAGRERRETEDLIGFFVHTLALRVDLAGAPTVAQLLGQVRARALEAQQHQDIPFEQVVERVRPARSLAHTPLFQVMFAWQDAAGGSLRLPGLVVAPIEPPGEGATAKFDLSLELARSGDRIEGGLNYATALFERATAERHLGYLRRVLEGMAADADRPVDALELLSEAERAQVVEEWNATGAAYPAHLCIHQLFEAQVERAPDAAAVTFDGQELTFAELNAQANRLAHHLMALGVGADVRVGLCLERGAEMVVALLATLKAGGAYVPLDPDAPQDRLRAMLEDSAPAVLLTQAALAGHFDH